MLLLSLGGLPPLTGFAPKLITIILLTESIKPVMFLLVVGSVINLFFYLNISINIILSPSYEKQTKLTYNKPSLAVITSVATLSLGLLPIILIYAMTLLN